jgi:hypothetical protein
MSRPSRELGAAKAVLITLAVTALGGVAYFMQNGSQVNIAKGTSANVPTFVVPEAPPVADDRPAPPKPANKDLELVKKGEMVQYRDKIGNTLYRKTGLVEGKTGTGKPLYFTMTVRPSPVPMAKFKGAGETGDKPAKKKFKGSDAPRLTMEGGKMTLAGAAAEGGDGGK